MDLCKKRIREPIEIYGQNEIMEITRDKLKIRNVASRLFSVPTELLEKIQSAHDALIENSSVISDIEQQFKATDHSLEELPTIEAKLKYYTEAGLDDKLELLKGCLLKKVNSMHFKSHYHLK